ncbi:hypothetical protein GF362_01230 [Candidatus Dojkabacteria bacterium]|nr:hypothetical protein [Candidatus Dojkabacteria bacterium]
MMKFNRYKANQKQINLSDKQTERYLSIPSVEKVDFDDLISFAERISMIEGNGSLEVKLKDYKVTIFIHHHKTYPKKTE